MNERPLSPHLTVWKWSPAMLVSILHRITGDGFAIFGLGILLWWLGAISGGAESYETFIGWVWADLGALEWSGGAWVVLASAAKVLLKLLMIGLSWAFFNHLISGIRHLVLDTGAGFELETNKKWSVNSLIAGIVLTAGFWAVLLLA